MEIHILQKTNPTILGCIPSNVGKATSINPKCNHVVWVIEKMWALWCDVSCIYHLKGQLCLSHCLDIFFVCLSHRLDIFFVSSIQSIPASVEYVFINVILIIRYHKEPLANHQETNHYEHLLVGLWLLATINHCYEALFTTTRFFPIQKDFVYCKQ